MRAGTFPEEMYRNFQWSIARECRTKEALMSKLPTALVLYAALLMTGCGTAEYDWNKAMAAGNLAAYQTFVKNHPTDRRADDARGRIMGLQDDQAWAMAQATHTVAGYREYLRTQSGGIHAAGAKYEITGLERAAAWKAVQNEESAESLRAFLQKYPQGLESNEARRKLGALESRAIRTPRNHA
jgi:hypothetical protein